MKPAIRTGATGIATALTLVFFSSTIAQTPAGAPTTQPAGSSTPASKQTTATSRSNTSLARGDRDFMMKAAQSDVAEIQGGQVAKEKASSDAVKKFADKMVTDHTKTSGQMKTMAESRSVALPTTPSAKDERDMKKMSGMSGADFDRAYMDSQVRAHRDAVSLFRKESKSGKDAELKSFAANTLPALEEHLKMATDLSKTVNAAPRQPAAPRK
jgi:putative membrane protein